MNTSLTSKLIALTVAAWIAAPALASAQVGSVAHPKVGIGGYLGYAEPRDSDEGAYHVGGSLTLRPIEILGLMLEVGYRDEELETRVEEIRTDADVRSIPVLVSALIYPFGQRLAPLVPYAVLGGGWYFTETELRGEVDGEVRRFRSNDVEVGWHAGAGLDFHLTPNLALSGDVRWVDLTTEFDDLDDDAEADGVWLTGGLKIFF